MSRSGAAEISNDFATHRNQSDRAGTIAHYANIWDPNHRLEKFAQVILPW